MEIVLYNVKKYPNFGRLVLVNVKNQKTSDSKLKLTQKI